VKPNLKVFFLLTAIVVGSSQATAGAPVTVQTLPFEPRASLGGTFYRVTGDTCSSIVDVTSGAATALPADKTLVACLVYARYSSATVVASVLYNGLKKSGYLFVRSNGMQDGTQWVLLSYAGYTDRICNSLVFGIRESDRQVNVGVYCLPNDGMKAKAVTYAASQIGPTVAAKPFTITDHTFVRAEDATMDIQANDSPVSNSPDGINWTINSHRYAIEYSAPIAYLQKVPNPQSENDYRVIHMSQKMRFENLTSNPIAWVPAKAFLIKIAGCKIADTKLLLHGESAALFTCGTDSLTLRLKNFQ
jgi:hypothetical protein